VIHLPRGSSMLAPDPVTGEEVRQDSLRGLVVFSRGEHTFLIMTETLPGIDWNVFMPRLSDFYRGMRFAETRNTSPGRTRLANRNAGT
jgi:hypothetical protein